MESSLKIRILMFLSIIFMTIGILLWILGPTLFKKVLEKEFIFTPNSKSFKIWKKTAVPMYFSVYMFNWTNPEEFRYNKPHFIEMGPYVFREIDYKIIQSWNLNGTVTFKQRRNWVFDVSKSNGSLTDHVTNLNPVAATLAYMIRNDNKIVKRLYNTVLKRIEKLAITQPVHKLLFDGYDDILLDVAKIIKKKVPFDKFAWFYNRNNSVNYDGVFNMLTGSDNVYNLGSVKEWNFKNSTNSFSSSCSKVSGYVGDFWPPLLNNDTVSIFSSDICTSLDLVKAGESEYLEMKGVKFISGINMLDNGTNVQSRKCYCNKNECQPSGVLNISSCKFEAPAFLSLPHFYLADDSYRSSIEGMYPDRKIHEFFLTLEPRSGVLLQVRAGFQLNFLVQPDPSIDLFKNINKTYIPMIWFKQEANLTEELANEIKELLILPMASFILLIVSNVIGVILLIIAFVIHKRQVTVTDGCESLIPNSEN